MDDFRFLLQLQDVSKSFAGVKALNGVDLIVRRGEVHCLVGENGAGKSTLMKIISGVYPYGQYEGKILYKGEEKRFGGIKDSERCGISIIHQELALIPYLSIEANIFLGNERARFSVIQQRETTKTAVALMKRVGLGANPKTLVSALSIGQKQLVEIAKSLSHDSELLIFDEPTAALNELESESLLRLILELREGGVTCIMISHKLNEVLSLADFVTILRDGETISSRDARDEPITEEQIIKGMVGRDLKRRYPEKTSKIGEVAFEVKDWSVYLPDNPSKKVVDNCSFNVREGEILGICGLMGSGRTELVCSLFGKSYGVRHQGAFTSHGKTCDFNSPHEAIENGIIYVSEDRKNLGLILTQGILFNSVLSSLKQFSKYFILNKRKEIKRTQEYQKKLKIKSSSVGQIVSGLSGGNQQKVVLSRCLMAEPRLLIVDEPTRGIDIGAKYEIYSVLNEFVSKGHSVVLVSSELPEVLGMSDRIYVMSEGRLVSEVEGENMNQEFIMECAIGASRSD